MSECCAVPAVSHWLSVLVGSWERGVTLENLLPPHKPGLSPHPGEIKWVKCQEGQEGIYSFGGIILGVGKGE